MNLYRLDYPDLPSLAVTNKIGMPYLTSSARKAREDAIEIAQRKLRRVSITRMSGAGSMKHTLTAHPSGRVTRAGNEEHDVRLRNRR
jgi:hypothetical protein